MSRRRNEDESVIKAAKPLLVTGMHRSGSTWVGRTLAAAPEVFYVHEPLNPDFAPHYLEQPDLPYYWKVTEAHEPRVLPAFQRLLSGRFPRIDARFFRPERRFISRFPQAMTFRWAAFQQKRFLIKDPFMLFNVEWFEQRFGGRVVLVTRSPLGFVTSLKARGWTFDFRHFTRQSALMDGPLVAHREAIERAAAEPPDIIEQGCLLWKVLDARIQALVQANPQRILSSHETLCRDPEAAFRPLFDRLDLSWSGRTRSFLRKGGQAAFTPSVPSGEEQDSAFDTRWAQRLTEAETTRIREATASG
ncbi:MAG: hypothetical protein GVY36_05745 [Verrucomicrobia bacterium]|jgi:hypothetical protein|nr:hypothetical protein [Verrucomicrobiota bacterium]